MWTGQGFILTGVFGPDCTYIISPLFQFLRYINDKKLENKESLSLYKSKRMSVSECVCLLPNSSETPKPDELKC